MGTYAPARAPPVGKQIERLQLQPALLLQKIDEHFLPYFFARAGL